MTHEQIKDYLKKYRIDSEEQLAKHIEELKRNTKPNNEIIFPLVDLLLNEKSALLSFFRENSKERGETAYVRTVTPFFLDEMLGKCSPQCYCDGSCKKPQEKRLGGYNKPTIKGNSTRHKSQAGEAHKEIVGDLVGINKPLYSVQKKDFNYLKELLNKTPSPSDFKKAIDLALVETEEDLVKIILEEKDDVITSSNRGEKETMEYLQGVKETEGKVNYGELDFDYVDSMALRMSKNLEKYPPKNWQKNMDIEELAKSAIRHARKILQQIENDEETLEEHAIALGCNGMMINYQLKVK